jgi:hypothetical protein
VLLSIVEELRAEDGSNGREGDEYQPNDGYEPYAPAVVKVNLAIVGGVDVEGQIYCVFDPCLAADGPQFCRVK